MPSVEFCRDGLFVRITREDNAPNILITIEDADQDRRVVIPCHLDDLLVAAHGLTFQTGSSDGHLLVTPDEDSVCLRFSTGMGRHRSCVVPKTDYESSLLSLKAGLY